MGNLDDNNILKIFENENDFLYLYLVIYYTMIYTNLQNTCLEFFVAFAEIHFFPNFLAETFTFMQMQKKIQDKYYAN